jgi:hypothetical protein
MVSVQRFVIFHVLSQINNSKIDLCVDVVEKNSGGMSNLKTQFEVDFAGGNEYNYPVHISLVYKSLVLSRVIYNLNSYFYETKNYSPIPILSKETQNPPLSKPQILNLVSTALAPLGSIPRSFVANHQMGHLQKVKVNTSGQISFVFESGVKIKNSETLVLKFSDILDESKEVLTTSGSTISSLVLPSSSIISSKRLSYVCVIETSDSDFERSLTQHCYYDSELRQFVIQFGASGFIIQKNRKYRLSISGDHLQKNQLIFTSRKNLKIF